MFNRNRLPDIHEDANLTDVNNGGSATDEDGDLEQGHNDTDTNSAPDENVEEEDSTPPIHSLAVRSTIVDGTEQVEIVATICMQAVHAKEAVEYETTAVVKDKAGIVQKDPKTGKVLYETVKLSHYPIITPGGVTSKRFVIPGPVTALQLAEHIFNIASW